MRLKGRTFGVSRRHFLGAAAALMVCAPALAQTTWPDGKPVNWVVPYPPGGSTDVLGRAIARQLDENLRTSVIVENRPGATGTIGAARVARATPDGYTLLGTSIGPQAIAPHVMTLPYDPVEDFAPVITVGTIPHILVVGAKQPFQSVQDLVTAAKQDSGGVTYASGGTGTILHMQGELLQIKAGGNYVHIPYKGDTPALQDTLGGQVQFMFAPAAASLPHIQNGTLRALAVTSAERLPTLPDVPTMIEEGFDEFVAEQWQAVFAPAGTPTEIVQKLNGAIDEVLKSPTLQELAQKLGITLVGGSPKRLDDLRRADFAKWRDVVSKANIK